MWQHTLNLRSCRCAFLVVLLSEIHRNSHYTESRTEIQLLVTNLPTHLIYNTYCTANQTALTDRLIYLKGIEHTVKVGVLITLQDMRQWTCLLVCSSYWCTCL